MKIVKKIQVDNKGILAIESAPFPGSDSRRTIWRVFPLASGGIGIETGRLVGTPGRIGALVLRVRIADIIEIRETSGEGSPASAIFYRIDKDFNLIPINSNGTDSDLERLCLECGTVAGAIGQLFDKGIETIEFLFGMDDEWFSSILKEYSDFVRETDLAILAENFPGHVTDEEIVILIGKNPYIVLKYLKNRLTDEQLVKCIRQSSEGAIRFALDKAIEMDLMSYYINAYSDVLLECAADRLTSANLDDCVSIAPECTYLLAKPHLSPIQVAGCLSVMFYACPGPDPYGKVTRKEFSQSMRRFPMVWARNFPEGDALIFEQLVGKNNRVLIDLLSINPSDENVALFMRSRDVLRPAVYCKFLDVVASRI